MDSNIPARFQRNNPPDLIKAHFRGKIIQYLKAASKEQANAEQAAA